MDTLFRRPVLRSEKTIPIRDGYQKYLPDPVFADAIWVDAWPLETDLPAVNLFDGDQFAGSGMSRIAVPRHSAPLSAAVRNFSPKNRLPGAVNVSFAALSVPSSWEPYS